MVWCCPAQVQISVKDVCFVSYTYRDVPFDSSRRVWLVWKSRSCSFGLHVSIKTYIFFFSKPLSKIDGLRSCSVFLLEGEPP